MTTISSTTTLAASGPPDMATQSPTPEYGDTTLAGGSESAVLRAMADAERLIGEFSLKQNIHDMKESLLRREASLQKKQAFAYESSEKEKDKAAWLFAGRLTSSVLGIIAGGIALGGVAGAGRQMAKASAEGSLSGMTAFTERGNKVDTWNRVGQSGQFVQQGVGGVATAVGEKQAADYEVQKRCQDIQGQISDSDVQIATEMQRRRNADVGESTKRVEKMNDTRLEYLRAAVRTMA